MLPINMGQVSICAGTDYGITDPFMHKSVIRWGRQALYHNFGKERFHDATLDQADSQLLIALWVIAQLPLTVQFELRILRQMYDHGVTTGDPAVVSFRMAEGAVYKAIPKVVAKPF